MFMFYLFYFICHAFPKFREQHLIFFIQITLRSNMHNHFLVCRNLVRAFFALNIFKSHYFRRLTQLIKSNLTKNIKREVYFSWMVLSATIQLSILGWEAILNWCVYLEASFAVLVPIHIYVVFSFN